MCSFRQRRRFQLVTGLSLIEVLVALTILSVAIVGLFGAFILGSSAAGRSRNLDEAVALADSKLKELVYVTSDKLAEQDGTENRFTYSLTLASRDHDLYAACIRVQWLEGGQTQEYVLSRVFCPISAQEGEE